MNRSCKVLGSAVLALIGQFLAITSASSGELPKRTTPEKFALMVGIDTYPVCALEGCRNDIEDMKKVLISNYNFSEDHIKTLYDDQATRDNILQAFRTQLIENAIKHPDGIFVFEYSGHGGYLPDDDGDETDGFDETLIPYDAIKDANNDIRDDKLNDLFRELARHTDNITFIVDACHSASVTRGVSQAKVRAVDDDTQAQRVAKLNGNSRSAVRYRGPSAEHALPTGKKYVALSGCDSDETSAETTSNSRHNGLMTASLIAALNSSGKPRTYKDVWHQYATTVSSENNRQHPQIEGDVDRLVFGTANDRLEGGIDVHVEKDKVVMDAGQSGGITSGALVAIYSKDATRLAGDQNLIAQGVVDEVGATSSVIRLSDSSIPLQKLNEAKAVLLSPPVVRTMSVGFRTTQKYGNDWLNALKSRIGEAKCFKLDSTTQVSSSPESRKDEILIVPMSYEEYLKLRDHRIKELSITREVGREGYVLLTKSGDVLFDKFVDIPKTADSETARTEVAAQIENILYRAMRQNAVRALTNEKSGLNDALKVTAYKVKTDAQGKVISRQELTSTDNRTPKVVEGEKIQFEIENTSKTTVYPTVVDLGTGGGVQIVYPPNGGATPLPSGAKFFTPVMEAGAPYGVEAFKFIATTKKADFDFLNTEGAVRGNLRSTERGESMLRDVVIKAATGDVGSVPNLPTPDEWTTTISKVSIIPDLAKNNTANQ